MRPDDETTSATTTSDPVDGSGAVAVSGRFPAGTVVRCYSVASEAVLRVDADATLVGERIADENGDVGFAGLEIGGRYFVTGYVDGRYTEIRAIGQDPAEPSSSLSQPPNATAPLQVGTQQETVEPVAPAPPADDLETGVPDGVSTGVLPDAAPEAAVNVYTRDGKVVGRIPASAAVNPLQPLYSQTDEGAMPEGFTLYSGDVEVPPDPSDVTSESKAEATATAHAPAADAAPIDDPNPPSPDAGAPNASESSGTGQANGGAVEQEPPADGAVAPDPSPSVVDPSAPVEETTAIATADAPVDPSAPAAADASASAAPAVDQAAASAAPDPAAAPDSAAAPTDTAAASS